MPSFNESIIEDTALTWFGELGYAVGHEPHLAPGKLLMKTAKPHLAEATHHEHCQART